MQNLKKIKIKLKQRDFEFNEKWKIQKEKLIQNIKNNINLNYTKHNIAVIIYKPKKKKKT